MALVSSAVPPYQATAPAATPTQPAALPRPVFEASAAMPNRARETVSSAKAVCATPPSCQAATVRLSASRAHSRKNSPVTSLLAAAPDAAPQVNQKAPSEANAVPAKALPR